MSPWSIVVVKKTRDKFHHKFVVGLRAHPLLYMGVNLGILITQIKAKAITMRRMKARGHL